MSLCTRILDLLPVVAREPVTIPAPATTPIGNIEPSSVDREGQR
jgi:hypothetical protein